jgi:asparagine synthase (glutamine-hydrolysing)
LPTYHVSRLAREHVTVVLSGDGGDEMFAGYSIYQGMLFARNYRRFVPNLLGRHVLPNTIRTLSRLLPNRWRYQGQRVAKVLRDSALAPTAAYRDKASIFQAAEITQLLTGDVLPHVKYLGPQYLPNELWSLMVGDGDLVGRLTELDIRSYLLDDILVKVDRMSMAHSLEVRSPLLDYRVAELAARMPTSMKIRGGAGKYLLREVLKDKLPPAAIKKGKQGFSVPLRDWFRNGLSDWVQDYLGPNGYLPVDVFAQNTVQKVLREHQRGVVDHSRKIWLLLAFAAWHRQYQCGSSSTPGITSTNPARPVANMVGGADRCES